MRTLSHSTRSTQAVRRKQRGVAMVEFALVALIFFTLLLGIMELGRWLFTLGAANEATRWGARLAVVCGSSETLIQGKVSAIYGGNGKLQITYPASDCATADCMVTANLVGATFTPLIPFLGGTYAIPPFTTTLPREYMKFAGNPVCPP